jgi:hypothetical protein
MSDAMTARRVRSRGAAREGPPKSEGAAKCRACGTEFTNSAWTKLDLSMLIAPGEIHQLVLGWPDDVCVEVRVCSRCQGQIPMKRKSTSIG